MPASKLPATPRALLDSLTDAEALPALVQRMEPATLKNLVDDVGIEDAAALVAHATSTQIAHLVEESVWSSGQPGDPERLSVPELLRWFDLWIDIGDNFIAHKLHDLGESFCALTFSKLLVVTASDLWQEPVDETTQVIGSYLARSRYDDEWESVQGALTALWDEYPDFLEALLARLAFRHSMLNLGDDDQERVLDADATHAREQQREQAGFVTAAMAGTFLSTVAATELDVLCEETGYDLETAQYFARRDRAQNASTATGSGRGSVQQPAADAPPSLPARTEITDAELEQLEREIDRYQLLRAGHQPRLSGPADARATLPLRKALAKLGDDPGALEARMGELSYLANLLMQGAMIEGRRLREAEAAELVTAACNLGSSYLLWLDLREDEDPSQACLPFLRSEPGLVRLFRIGWHLLSRLPLQVASRIFEVLSGPAFRDRLGARPWLRAELDALLSTPDIRELARSGAFDELRETVQLLSIVLESDLVAPLMLLCDRVPRLARSLPEPRPGNGNADGRASAGARFVQDMADLTAVDRFLHDLEALCTGAGASL
ncbi:MAG: DUF6178 family protein [Pseudomonadales bacterium]